MKVILQRVLSSSVTIDEKIVGTSKQGYLLLVGFTHGDTIEDIQYLADKVMHLRVFSDEKGAMNLSILDIQGSILSISQFTLYANAEKGRRPSFIDAMKTEEATVLYDKFNEVLKTYGLPVETGVFGADMKVELINDGPVTICLESRKKA